MFRSDLWAAAFVRRHNDLGHMCVVARRGDPIAGQIFIEIDHLNGTVSLLTPAPATARRDDDADRLFVRRFDHGDAAASPLCLRSRRAQPAAARPIGQLTPVPPRPQ